MVYAGLLTTDLGAFSADLGTFSADLGAFSANLGAFSIIKLRLGVINTMRGGLRIIRIIYAELGLNRSVNYYKVLRGSDQSYRGI